MRTLSPFSSIILSGIHHHLHHLQCKTTIPFLFLFSFSSSSSSATETLISNTNSNHLVIDYLTDSFGLSKTRAYAVSNRFSWIKSLEQPQSVVNYLQKLGFTDSQIRSSVNVSPRLLFARIDKTLRPKLEFFQDLGFVGSDLGEFISNNPSILTHSLRNKMIPCTQILQNILIHDDDDNNENLLRVLRRCSGIIIINPHTTLLCNVEYLTSCGIVGSQLSMLLTRQPNLFIMKQSRLIGLVSKVQDLGFSIDMLVHAIYAVSPIVTDPTFKRKFELLLSFGFSEDQCMEMFRRAPGLRRVSEGKLMLGIEFFMHTIKFNKLSLVRHPNFLMHSIEKKVIPRYNVLQLIKSKRLLKKEPSYTTVLLYLTEEEFVRKFISRFRDDALELLIAYKGHLLDSADD